MKILYLVTSSGVGGVSTHISQLSRHFKDKGWEIAVMSRPGGWLEEDVKKIGIKFYPNSYFSNFPNPFAWLKAKKEIEKVVSNFEPDLISCHSTVAGFLTRIAVKNKILTIFTAHGWGFTMGVPFFRKIPVILVEKYISRFCSKIICVSDYDKNIALKYKIASLEKLTVVHNGVEIKEPQILNLKPQEEKIRMVFVGRLAKQKDPLLFLEAISELEQGLKEKLEVSIVGEGPKRKKLENFIKKNNLKIKLLGELKRERVFEVLKQNHVFVLISKWEGFPRTILEAMTCGLAIIASDVGGTREAVDKSCGILVERGDKEGVKNAIQCLLENPQKIENMAKNAQNRVREKFSLEKMFKETEKVYLSIK